MLLHTSKVDTTSRRTPHQACLHSTAQALTCDAVRRPLHSKRVESVGVELLLRLGGLHVSYYVAGVCSEGQGGRGAKEAPEGVSRDSKRESGWHSMRHSSQGCRMNSDKQQQRTDNSGVTEEASITRRPHGA
jgi:hypothetical protein